MKESQNVVCSNLKSLRMARQRAAMFSLKIALCAPVRGRRLAWMTSRSINCSEILPQSAYCLDSNDLPCLQGQSVGWFTGLHSLQGWVSKPTAATLGMLRSMEFYQHLQGGEGRQLPVAVDGGWEGRPSQNILLLLLPRVW